MWLQINFLYFPVTAVLFTHLIFWGTSIEKIVGLETSYYIALILIAAAFGLGFLGLYPFNAEKKLTLKFKDAAVYIFLLAWPLSCINAVMQNDIVLFWYPTNNSLWAVLPVFMIAAIAWFKGIRVGEN